jgi:membrane protease YdiL (CAAX protease family)
MRREHIILLSPLAVIGLCHVVARITGRLWGLWSWVPVLIVYWLALSLLLVLGGGRPSASRWLQPSQGAWGWRLLAFLNVALFIPVWAGNFQALNQAWIVASWLALAAIDPWLEEGYWRGLLMDASRGWPVWLRLSYSTVWFGLSHPLILGVNVRTLSGFPGFLGTCFTGSIWAVVYWKTGSLRWPVLSHIVVDLASVSVLVFLDRAMIGG